MYNKTGKRNDCSGEQSNRSDSAGKKKTRIDHHNYVDEAENSIKRLKEKRGRNGKTVEMVSTSKIRNLLAMAADIYNVILNCDVDQLSEDICERIEYLRVRFMYEAGREPKVKALLEETCIIELLKGVKGSKKNFILFQRYMESLVAFHRYYGGKEN